MHIIRVFAFILFIVGFFIKFNLTPKAYFLDIVDLFKKVQGKHKYTLRERIKKAKITKKENYFEKLVNETKEMMINNGTISKFNKLILISIVLCVIGTIISLLINNIFLLPILTILFGLIPFYYVRIQNMIYKDEVKKELETALSNITSSYLRQNTTFVDAVKENVDNIKYPLKASFKRFVITTEHLNSNTRENLENLKNAVSDDTYKEWIDGIIASEEDYNLKATLPNIINKFSDMRIINNELSTKMYAPLKDYIYMVILTIVSIPLFYLFNKDAVISYLTLPLGKIELAIIFIIIIVVSSRVIRELKPAEYRR